MSTLKNTESENIILRLSDALEFKGIKRYGRNKLIAEKTGFSGNHISEIFAGKCDVTDRFIKQVCYHFGISENWVRANEGEMFVAEVQPPYPLVRKTCCGCYVEI